MPTISVITAAYAPTTADYIGDAARSIAEQHLPRGWSLEWVVQEDGDQPSMGDDVSWFRFARYEANGQQLGIAATRNLALARARGDLVQALDADDVLLRGALATLIPRFVENAITWAIGQADDLMPDKSRKQYPSPIPFGLQKAGVINAWAEDHGANWPIHGAALLWRTAHLRALGGWAGIPGDDELSTFAALSEVTDGWYDETMTWLYRHHDRQASRTAEIAALSETTRRICLQRARAMAAVGLSFPPESMVGFPELDEDVRVGPAAKGHVPLRAIPA